MHNRCRWPTVLNSLEREKQEKVAPPRPRDVTAIVRWRRRRSWFSSLAPRAKLRASAHEWPKTRSVGRKWNEKCSLKMFLLHILVVWFEFDPYFCQNKSSTDSYSFTPISRVSLWESCSEPTTRIHTYMLNTYFAKEHVLLSYASRWLKWPKMITILSLHIRCGTIKRNHIIDHLK